PKMYLGSASGTLDGALTTVGFSFDKFVATAFGVTKRDVSDADVVQKFLGQRQWITDSSGLILMPLQLFYESDVGLMITAVSILEGYLEFMNGKVPVIYTLNVYNYTSTQGPQSTSFAASPNNYRNLNLAVASPNYTCKAFPQHRESSTPRYLTIPPNQFP